MYTALKLLVLHLFALTDQPLNTKQKISFIQYTLVSLGSNTVKIIGVPRYVILWKGLRR